MQLSIRRAKPDDSTAISQVAARTFALACPVDTPASEIDAYIAGQLMPANFERMSLAPNKRLTVALLSGRVIGYSLVSHEPEALGIAAADGIAELSKCYVLPEYHGKGVSQRLVADIFANVSGPLRLTVNDSNSRAIAFYTRNGFEVVGETTFQCGEDVHRDLVMLRVDGA
ncbi:MAG: GNAT family N-acetyltransferase [Pseudomonas sp.]|jgi:ribosomal protein S18 acetylase RimI-like enzyme|nr:GNAT family N-acetyltransferase [Pseudomonas sp.]